ncbi:MAG: rRNA maturation RNase YbeY [Deltaproteobacteria bacterium]|nr:rRNA maturation RNase YbeY [Deltaproteobacteria bacterium]
MSIRVLGQRLLRADAAAALDVIRGVFRAARFSRVDVGVTLVLDVEMRALNRRWRKKDKTTDVLSFSSWEGEFVVGDDRFLGDLVISVEAAARQARACGHDVVTEVGVLTCHGLVHLAGLDHECSADEHERQLMVEMGILDAAGLDPRAALAGR